MSALDSIFMRLEVFLGINFPWFNEPLQAVAPRVLVINYDPAVDGQGTKLSAKMGWNRVDDLIAGFTADIAEVSHGLVQYRCDPALRIDADEFPQKADGFRYTAGSYLAMMQDPKTHHDPDLVDYGKVAEDFHLFDRVADGEVDEVWMFGAPYFGYWESHMAGRGAIWCNSNPLAHSERCPRRFVIMGFNYERGVAQMLHSFGHRMESVVAHAFGSSDTLEDAYRAMDPDAQPPVGPERFTRPKNDFERILLFDKIAPGAAQVGLVHFPPNAEKRYDLRNPRFVSSGCDDWLDYPNLRGTRRMVNCAEWGGGKDEYDYNKWWLRRIPHARGRKNGVLNNWWRYAIQVERPFR
jgi:hypothetical protein